MMDLALSLIALVAGGVTLEIYAAGRAPLADRDKWDFHRGPETPLRANDGQGESPLESARPV